MSTFDLAKRENIVRFVLDKREVKQPPKLRVGAALDVSGSAQPLFHSGVMQRTLDRLVPLALKFDDNGELDLWAFDDGFAQLETVTKHNYEGYVKKEILNNSSLSKWGSTKYAGPWSSILEHYFPSKRTEASPATEKKGFFKSLFGGGSAATPAATIVRAPTSNLPAMGLFITDGANSDAARAQAVLQNSQDVPVYWQMIGVGDPQYFGFLEKMADDFPNVGFLHLNSLDISDEDLYDLLLSDELCNWLKKHSSK